eukprot:2988150-Rhodomonas_salina.1
MSASAVLRARDGSFHRMRVLGADSGLFNSVGDWSNYGLLFLNCSTFLFPNSNNSACMPSSSASHFSITLRNPTVARTGQTPRVSATSSSLSVEPQALLLLPEEPYPFVLGGREENGFVAASVSEETDMVAVENVLSFALTAN